MPIYEYLRSDGEVIEVIQNINSDPLVRCPHTGQPVERLVSLNSFQLKGDGWFSTQSRTEKDKKPTPIASEGQAAEKSSSTDTATVENKASAQTKSCASSCACH
jgi:putative FmdB family regulatory protein